MFSSTTKADVQFESKKKTSHQFSLRFSSIQNDFHYSEVNEF